MRNLHWKLLSLMSVGLFIAAWPVGVSGDPISAGALTWWASMALTASLSAASVGLQYLAAKRQKVAPVDRGKLDDIRAMVPGYGEFVYQGWGVFRVAPIPIWETPAVDHPIVTAGKSGGKMPKPPTPTTTEHQYYKSFAAVFHKGEIYGGVRRMWFDNDLVYNGVFSRAVGSLAAATVSSRKYEAEHGVLTGATVTDQAECSGGKKVTGLGVGVPVGSPFITSNPSGSLRSDFTGCLGFWFTTPASPVLTVSDLGRWKVAGNNQSHTVYLKDSGGSVVASAVVDFSAGGTNAAYNYTPITPVALTPSTTYYVLSSETNGGDQWYDEQLLTNSGAASAGNSVYQPICAGAFTNSGPFGYSYVAPNIKFAVAASGECEISVNAEETDDYELAVHYTSTTDLSLFISVDGGADVELECLASGGDGIVAIETLSLGSLTAGDHTITFSNSSGNCPDLDCIALAPARGMLESDTRSFSSGIDPNKVPPRKLDHSWAYNDFQPDVGDGFGAGGVAGTPFQSFTIANYGQPSIRIYRGTQTQEADPAIVAQEGAANTSAYRGFAYLVIEGLQLQNGRVPNVTLEVDQGVHSLPAIVTDIYEEVRLTASQVNVTGLAGMSLGSSNIDLGTYAVPTYQNVTNATVGSGGAISKTSGANHAWNAHATSTASVASAVNGAVRFTASTAPVLIGFATTASPTSTPDVIFGVLLNLTSNPSLEARNAIQVWNGTTQSPDIGKWAAGDSFQVEIRNGRFRIYQNGIEIQSFTPSVPTYPLYPVVFMYDTGAGPSALTISTAGAIGDAPSSDAGGLLLSSRRSAGELLADLQTRFQFDMVEVDGVVKAILRNGSTADVTIPYTDMRAVIVPEGQLPETPQWDCEIHDIDPLLLPDRVDVNYLDPEMDYHNNVQTEMALSDYGRLDNQSVSLSIIDQADNMKALAITLMHKAEMEGRSFSWQTSYKYLHVHPGSIASLPLPNATHTVRVTQAKCQLPCGVIEFQGVRQAASLYSPTATGSVSSGFEAPVAPIPANTKGNLIDGPMLRPEDAGDGTSPVLYRAMCGRGSGTWSGGFFYREYPIGSGNYELVPPNGTQQSQIGVTDGALATVSDPSVWDRVNSLEINFYTNTVLSSETEDDLLSNPELNLLAVINPTTNKVEYVQFKTAVAGTPVAPYLSNYTVSTFLRGRVTTNNNVGIHTSADDVVVMDSTVIPIRANLSDVGREIKYKFVSSGQTLEDAAAVTQTLYGRSLLTPAPAGLSGDRDSDGDIYIKWRRVGRIGGGMRPNTDVPLSEEKEVYVVRIPDATPERSWQVITGTAMAAVLNSDSTSSKFDWVDHNTLSGAAWPAVHQAASIQTIEAAGNFVQGTLVSSQTDVPEAWLGLIPTNIEWRQQWAIHGSMPTIYDTSYLVSLSYVNGLEIFVGGVVVYTDATITDEARVHILLSGSEVRFYVNYVGLGSTPIYVSPVPPSFPYRAFASVRGTSSVEKIILTTNPVPGTVYSTDQQEEDFGSPQDPVTVRVAGLSAVVGEGEYIEEEI